MAILIYVGDPVAYIKNNFIQNEMSKLNQIESKLKELGDAAFQKFADAYLHKNGYDKLNALGSVTGINKVRKGTPDTLIILPNGQYIFAEYSTQQTGLFTKFKGDLSKCLNEEKTGIPITKIKELIFCYTAELSASEIESLQEECQQNQINLNLFGNSRIAYDLLLKYPGLAHEFLDIEVDTGQILDLDEFISAYNKYSLSTPLDTAFHFRQEELKNAVAFLESSDLLIISGRAGIGKSRFTIECCRTFLKTNANYQVHAIFNRGPDIFTDLQLYFAEPGYHLIFVDDANRINKFDYVLQLLHNQNANRKVKIIATVRDYAFAKVKDAARGFIGVEYLELHDFTKDQIIQLVDEECGIKNQLYLDRIADIAKGNPRLAIMAGKVARQENKFDSIIDVSGLYDEYFRSIRNDIEGLGDSSVIGAAGLVSFFRNVDRTNQEVMKSVQITFGYSEESFWTCVLRLHESEILDVMDNEIVRITDQVLASYLFYYCFFKQKTLSFADLLIEYFPKHRERFQDSLYPVINAFHSKQLMDSMRTDVDHVWNHFQKSQDTQSILYLCESFWFVKTTDVLVYVKDIIDNLETITVPLTKGEVKSGSYIESPSILSILRNFSQTDENTFKIVLSFIYDYLEKRPSDLSKVYDILIGSFGFHHKSHFNDYKYQKCIVDTLKEKSRRNTNPVFTKLLFRVYQHYLDISFTFTEPGGLHSFNLITFQLVAIPALFELRKVIWEYLFELFKIVNHREQILDILKHYSTAGFAVTADDIYNQDSIAILPFVESNLNPDSYTDCIFVHTLLDLFENHKVPFKHSLRTKFTNKLYTLSELLFEDNFERKNLHLEYQEYEKLRQRRLIDCFTTYTLVDYQDFLKNAVLLKNALKDSRDEYQFHKGIIEILLNLASSNISLFTDVLRRYLTMGDPLALNPIALVDNLFKEMEPIDIWTTLTFPTRNSNRYINFIIRLGYLLLNKTPYLTLHKWLFAYFQVLPPKYITKQTLKQLVRLYKKANYTDLPPHLDYLLKYWEVDSSTYIRITRIVLKKTRTDNRFGYGLNLLFNQHTEANKKIDEIFRGNIDLLKKAYLCVLGVEPHIDYDGTTLNKILNIDPGFIADYINWMYGKKEWLSKHDDSRDYSSLWKRTDYMDIITRIVNCILDHHVQKRMSFDSYIESYFTLGRGSKDVKVIEERQDKFIAGLIEYQSHNIPLMKLIFSVIVSFPPARRLQFIAKFVKHNKDYNDFEKLTIEPLGQSWSGSRVPVLYQSIIYLESLLPIFNSPELLRHKQLIENCILRWKEHMEYEKKRDFINA
jgi:hypothetical protein